MIRNRIIALVILVGLASLPAMADTLTYTFTSDHCTVPCLPNGQGLITVTDVAGGVSVDVQLPATWGFVSTGAGTGNSGPASFFFNLTTSGTITYSGITAGWQIPNVIGASSQAAGQYAGDGLMNQYEYALSCNPPGSPTGCGNGGSSPKAPPLDFTLTGITTASFSTVGDPFAADVIAGPAGSPTDLVDATFFSRTTPTVPEPSSILLLGTGMIGLAVTMRRKIQR